MKSYKLIDLKTVLNIYPVSRATLYRQIKSGSFPEPYRLGTRRSAWNLDEVEECISELKKVALRGNGLGC
ncbi:prophage CP4-57 regulatory [Mangrovibacter sp. MFB070]|uniref:helix-turn-helix transcriptional regulator n=1 Tax=Mangrovibacter sp. MFB070 TaxID=1224318 RepID=UPI0004D65F0A|nr:AlpA family phage regulatory protein [Mangrovibacter sp. MFB070]KEA53982.1 prophage CP4-57 regulatory [Mangrovibacter sp. MFB070]